MMDQGMGSYQPGEPAIHYGCATAAKKPSKSEGEIVTQNDDEAPAFE